MTERRRSCGSMEQYLRGECPVPEEELQAKDGSSSVPVPAVPRGRRWGGSYREPSLDDGRIALNDPILTVVNADWELPRVVSTLDFDTLQELQYLRLAVSLEED